MNISSVLAQYRRDPDSTVKIYRNRIITMLATVESIRRCEEGMVQLDIWPTNEVRRLAGKSVITLLVDTVSGINTSWVEEGQQIWLRARMLTMDNHTLACQAMKVMPAPSTSEPST